MFSIDSQTKTVCFPLLNYIELLVNMTCTDNDVIKQSHSIPSKQSCKKSNLKNHIVLLILFNQVKS